MQYENHILHIKKGINPDSAEQANAADYILYAYISTFGAFFCSNI